VTVTRVGAGSSDGNLRWQCRRGMRELDILLQAYLEQGYTPATEAHKCAFRKLLALADPELASYLLGGQLPGDATLASVVSDIRNRTYA
jgi:antitoxin CptB